MTPDLPKGVIDMLAPALTTLARLIASRSELSDDELQILLMGAGLQPEPAVLAELRHWGTLLRTAQEQPSEEYEAVVLQALMARGLPAEEVILAVTTAAESGMEPPSLIASQSGKKLAVSVKSLDFGILNPGQSAAAEIEVQGGSGQVLLESNLVRVTPPTFGEEATRLQVEVKAPTGRLLWESIKLVTLEEAVELPVLALWQETEPQLASPTSTDADVS